MVLGSICSSMSVRMLLSQRGAWETSTSSQMLCALDSHAIVFPLKGVTFGKWRLWVSFPPLKTRQVREKTKLSELTFLLCAEICSFIKPLNHLP